MNKKRSDGSLCPGPGHATSCPCGRGCEEPELIACASCGPDQCEDCVIESLRTELAGKEKTWEQAFAHELELIKSDKVLRAELAAQKEDHQKHLERWQEINLDYSNRLAAQKEISDEAGKVIAAAKEVCSHPYCTTVDMDNLVHRLRVAGKKYDELKRAKR